MVQRIRASSIARGAAESVSVAETEATKRALLTAIATESPHCNGCISGPGDFLQQSALRPGGYTHSAHLRHLGHVPRAQQRPV